MKTTVKCECGKLNGTASLKIIKSLKPQLVWEMSGTFAVDNKNNHLICVECKKPALGSDWK